MANKRLLVVKELIQEGKFAEARALLNTIDDPRVAEWMTKLDEMIEKSSPSLPSSTSKKSITPQRPVRVLRPVQYDDAGRSWNTSLSTVVKKMETMSMPALVGVVIAVTLIVTIPLAFIARNAVSPAAPACSISVWWDEAESEVVKFLDISETAASTSRISLSGVVVQMSGTYRDFQKIEQPVCASTIGDKIDQAMKKGLDANNSFLGENEYTSLNEFESADQYFEEAFNMLKKAGITPDPRMADFKGITIGS